jgi:hypothetical protein
MANGTWGLIPFVGPLGGLLYLSLRSPKTTNKESSWAVRLFVSLVASLVLLMASYLGLVQWSHREVNAFYAAAKDGVSLVEALEQHPRWAYINFGEKLIEEEGSDHSRAGRNDCGSVRNNYSDNELSFNPVDSLADSDGHRKSYSSVRDLFRANPQVFARCSWVYVIYPTIMFQSGGVVVQVDAQGKIVLAKEPVYWGD